jgi:hypothetical protein
MSQSSFTVDDVRQIMDDRATELTFQLYNVLINRTVLLETSSEATSIRDGAVDRAISLIHDSGVVDPQSPSYDGLTQTMLECAFMYDVPFMDRLAQKQIVT